MTDTLETTWARLAPDDTVLDATGKQWRVYSAPETVRDGDAIKVRVGITDGTRYLDVTKDSTEKVLTVPAAVADITNGAVATETAAEAQARQSSDTFPDASTLSPLELRTHLYLVHGDTSATKVGTQDQMLANHTELHSRDLGAKPHEHTEAT